MKEESITKAVNIIVEALEKSNINNQDKIELMINLNHFLQNYEKETNIAIEKKEKRYEKVQDNKRNKIIK